MNNRFSKYLTKLVVLLLSFCLVLGMTPPVMAETTEQSVATYLEQIEGVINWKKATLDIDQNAPLLNNTFLKNAGDTSGDWYPIGMGRIGYPDEFNNYLAVIRDVVENRYEQKQKLHSSKATEWHRISLAILASKGDPTHVGTDQDGNPINLIADGTYNRGETRSLGTQGLNGWLWGLIALDSMRYSVPDDAHDNRQTIIKEILKAQQADGGFSLNQSKSDPDMTGMAIQALAPYYNSEEIYTYKLSSTEKKKTKRVRDVIDSAIDWLSDNQLETGDFESMGTPTAESTAQVIVALTSLGINPLTDERFIKGDHDLYQGIMNYMMEDGGFIHSDTDDPENPSANPDESNTMSSEQMLYALTSLYRQTEGYRTLYDFRPEMNEGLKSQIQTLNESIETIPDQVTAADKNLIKELFAKYLEIPIEERSYVHNYVTLADAMDELGIDNTSEPFTENMGINEDGEGTVTLLFNQEEESNSDGSFTEKDKEAAESIPDDVTTEHYVQVVSLIDKLESSTNKDDYSELLTQLQEKKKRIKTIENEIDALNQTVVEQLYPFSDIGIKDRKNVNKIIERYEDLSADDQQKIQSYADVKRAKTQINNMIRARVITIVLIIIIGLASLFYVKHLRKRKRDKLKQEMVINDEG